MTLYKVFQAGSLFLTVIRWAILLYVVLSWVRLRGNAYLWLEGFVRPFVAPFRRLSVWLMNRTRMPLDFSCWFALIGLSLVNQLWWWLYTMLRALR